MTLARLRMSSLVIAAGTAALLTPLLGVTAPAQAATRTAPAAPAAPAGHGGGLAGPRGGGLAVADSTNFAGYQAAVKKGAPTSSAAEFKLPKLTCTKAYHAITPVAGVAVNDYASYSSAFVFTGCYKGSADYFPALVVNGSEDNYTGVVLHAGDVIKVSTSVTSKATKVTVTDVTTKVTKTRKGKGATTSAAYIGDSDWFVNGVIHGVPAFGTVDFTGCAMNGKSVAAAKPVRYQRVNSKNVVQIATGALSSGGTAFLTTFKHS